MRDEHALLAAYKSTGDLRALGKLYEPYMPLLYGVCFNYFQDQAKSEDAVMQIFESLITKLREHEVTHFKSWLYTLARNHCLMQLRKEQRVTMVAIDDLESRGEALSSQSGSAVNWTDDAWGDPYEKSSKAWLEKNLVELENCMISLPQEQQECVRLFFLEQRCYQEIADQLNFTMKQVKSYIQNGKRNLKLCMERKGYGK